MHQCTYGGLGPVLQMSNPYEERVGTTQAVSLAGSVGRGGLNRRKDVEALQGGLNRIRADQGGAFPHLAVDGICGPKTIAGIQGFQQRNFGSSDGRFDPAQRSLAKLNSYLALSPTNTADGLLQGMSPSLLSMAEETRVSAGLWLTAACTKAASDRKLVDEHFHLDRTNSAVGATYQMQVLQVLLRMKAALNRKTLFSLDQTGSPHFAYAFMGGFDLTGEEPGGAQRHYDLIYICSQFGTLWIKSRTAVIVHELAHYVGGSGGSSQISHFAREIPFPDGKPQDGCPRNYKELTPEEAMHNAATYSTFAIHAFYGFDNREGSF